MWGSKLFGAIASKLRQKYGQISEFYNSAGVYSGEIYVDSNGHFRFQRKYGSTEIAKIIISGTTTATANIALSNAHGYSVNFGPSSTGLYPSSNALPLGTSTNMWKDGYFSGNLYANSLYGDVNSLFTTQRGLFSLENESSKGTIYKYGTDVGFEYVDNITANTFPYYKLYSTETGRTNGDYCKFVINYFDTTNDFEFCVKLLNNYLNSSTAYYIGLYEGTISSVGEFRVGIRLEGTYYYYTPNGNDVYSTGITIGYNDIVCLKKSGSTIYYSIYSGNKNGNVTQLKGSGSFSTTYSCHLMGVYNKVVDQSQPGDTSIQINEIRWRLV